MWAARLATCVVERKRGVLAYARVMLTLRRTTQTAWLDAALADFDAFLLDVLLDEEAEIVAGLEIRAAPH